MAEEKKLPDADESADPESQESKEKGPKYDSIVEEQEVKPINLKHFFVVCASVIVFIGLCLAWAGLAKLAIIGGVGALSGLGGCAFQLFTETAEGVASGARGALAPGNHRRRRLSLPPPLFRAAFWRPV